MEIQGTREVFLRYGIIFSDHATCVDKEIEPNGPVDLPSITNKTQLELESDMFLQSMLIEDLEDAESESNRIK